METFKIDDVEFVLDPREGHLRDKSSENRFVLVKNQRCLDFYRNWEGDKPKQIMEVGLFEGGSLVLLDKLFKPEKIVGLEIKREPIEPLELYRKNNPHMITYYGRSQDMPGTGMAARQNFPNGIDLVVDDASHLFAQTKATFEMLFPLVKPGGKYVIEDWAWAHRANRQTKKDPWATEPAMSNLILMLMTMAVTYPVLDKIEIHQELVSITKGRGALPQNPFDLSPILRGRKMPLI